MKNQHSQAEKTRPKRMHAGSIPGPITTGGRMGRQLCFENC